MKALGGFLVGVLAAILVGAAVLGSFGPDVLDAVAPLDIDSGRDDAIVRKDDTDEPFDDHDDPTDEPDPTRPSPSPTAEDGADATPSPTAKPTARPTPDDSRDGADRGDSGDGDT